MRPRALLLALGLLAGALALATPGSPAGAHHVSCPTYNACIWAGTGWQTDGDHDRYVRFSRYIPNFGDWRYGQQTGGTSSYTANNNASSMSNRGTVDRAYLFNGYKSGAVYSWAPGSGDQDLSNGPAGFNNVFSSGYFATFL